MVFVYALDREAAWSSYVYICCVMLLAQGVYSYRRKRQIQREEEEHNLATDILGVAGKQCDTRRRRNSAHLSPQHPARKIMPSPMRHPAACSGRRTKEAVAK